MASHEQSDGGQQQPKPISLSLSSSKGPSTKTGFSIQSSNRGRPTNSPTTGRSLPRRPHQQLDHGDDSDEEDGAPVLEEVRGFNTLTGGAITAEGKAVEDKNKPLVIPVTSKNNWRDRAGVNVKKSKNLLPAEVQAMQEAQKNGQTPGEATVETDVPSMAFGLSFAQQSTEQTQKGGVADEDQAMPDAKPVETVPLTDDQIAMQALIRESKGEVERRSDLVIEGATKGGEDDAPVSEIGTFRNDVASRPDPATLDAYNAIPVEEFGAALLRGMGWKDGQSIGRGDYSTATAAERAKKPRVPERRPGFLGIGAKDSSGGKGAEVELGAWGKSAMRKASRKQGEENDKAEGVYMPITMRNKKTGEHLTEEELAALQKEANSKPAKEEDWRERRDRNLEKSGRDKDRDRDYRKRAYDDDDDRTRRKTGSSRRDRSRSSGRHSSSRSSRYDDDDRSKREDRSYRDRDYDRDRRRDRDDDKDRRRDGDRERDRDRSRRSRDDKYSSSRHSSHSSRNDRDRDRDRDSRRSRRDD